ncbi:MAG: 30S ribosomal protein S6 [Patescibacteria group bacterium]
MRSYELTLLLSPQFQEEEVRSRMEKILSAIQEAGGILEKQAVLGRKKTPGRKGTEKEGILAILSFLLGEGNIQGIQDMLGKEGGVRRFLLLSKAPRKERPAPSFASRDSIPAEPEEHKPVDAESIDKRLEEIFKE